MTPIWKCESGRSYPQPLWVQRMTVEVPTSQLKLKRRVRRGRPGWATAPVLRLCPVRALRAWLRAAKIVDGPVFRRVTQWGTVGKKRLHPDAVRQILARRAAAAGIKGTLLEPVTPRGMRAGFVTTA